MTDIFKSWLVFFILLAEQENTYLQYIGSGVLVMLGVTQG